MADTPAVRRALAGLPSVQAQVSASAQRIEALAKAGFARHDRPGGHRIESERDGLDRLVSLVGPAPVALENGHFAPDGSWVDGIHVLSRAVEQA